MPVIRFFIKKTTGLENLPKKGPYIIACKHLATLDGAFIAAVIIPYLNQKVYFIANIAKWGWFWENVVGVRWAANIPFDRDNPRLCLEIATDYLLKGKIVGIFPEGVIQEYDGKKRRAKTGTARLAIRTHVPIVPIGMSHDISVPSDLPGQIRIFRRRQAIKNILMNPHSMEINIGEPFTLSAYYDKEITQDMLEQATNEIMDKIDRLTKVNNFQNY